MGSIVPTNQELENASKCAEQCCTLGGNCWVRPARCEQPQPDIQPQPYVRPQGVSSGICHPHNRIRRQSLLSQRSLCLKMSLDPTPDRRARDHTNSWGSRNRFALLSTCRQIYHEARYLAYKQNMFRLDCPSDGDFWVPRAPGMPFDNIRHLHLHYPPQFGARMTHRLAYIWENWLHDALHVTSRFRYLQQLTLVNTYIGALENDGTWVPLFNRSDGEPEFTDEAESDVDDDSISRLTRVVQALAKLTGRRMPCVVQVMLARHNPDCRRVHNLQSLNLTIPRAVDRTMTVWQYMHSFPAWRPGDRLREGGGVLTLVFTACV